MTDDQQTGQWDEQEVELKDIVISNSWALQAILKYLDNLHPGARDEIWRHYLEMKSMADAAKDSSGGDSQDTDVSPETN